MKVNKNAKNKQKEYNVALADKRRDNKQLPKDKRTLRASTELISDGSSNLQSPNKILSIFVPLKSKEFDQEKEEREEREIRRRARREISLEDDFIDEFASTVFEQVNALLKPVTNFECLQKRKVGQMPSLSQLSTSSTPPPTPAPSVYLCPNGMPSAGFISEKPEYALSDGTRSLTDPTTSEKKSGKSDETDTDPSTTDRTLETTAKKDETLSTTRGSSGGSRERVEEKEKAMGQSTYSVPDLRMEQNLTTANDMSYFDVSSSTVTPKKGSMDSETKAVTSEIISATENATKQTLPSRSLPPSSRTVESNIATSRLHHKIFTTIRRGVGVFGGGATRKVKEGDVSNKKTTVVKGSELDTTLPGDTSKRKKDKSKTDPSI
ncbi:unnamed protein product [Litomosoides sigmodontis]|uniref:Uncharacterized protein n=1 Tax=Litomosoides sigmodontis TaxID=42156 RepID=A0A3P6SES1_LITSI|nr:unnamed protein product [Litomosoides sigmodontis]